MHVHYAVPHATDMPEIREANRPVPATTNPLGVKGVGESGCTASLACVMNAIIDALASRGVTALDMPATPERIWRALGQAKKN